MGTEFRNGIEKLRGRKAIVARYCEYEIEPFASRLKIWFLGSINIEETMEGGTLIEVLNEDR